MRSQDKKGVEDQFNPPPFKPSCHQKSKENKGVFSVSPGRILGRIKPSVSAAMPGMVRDEI